MKSLLKWTAIVAAALLALAGGTSLLLRALVDEAALEAALVDVVNRNIEGELRVDGQLQVSLWPSLALAASDAHLDTPAGAATEFASARELRLGLALLPLLRGELRVSELVADGLVLNLECGAGACNWSGLTRGPGSTTAAAPASGKTAEAAPMLLNVERVVVSNGRVSYSNRDARTRAEFDGIQIQGENINLAGEPFRLRAEAVLTQGDATRTIAVKLAAQVGIARESGRLALEDVSLALAPQGAAQITLELPSATMDLDAKTLDAPALKIGSAGIALDGALRADWSRPDGPSASGRIDAKALDLPALLAAAGTAPPASVNADALRDMSLACTFSLAEHRLALDDVSLRAGRFSAAGDVKIGLGETRRIDLDLSSPELDLDYLLPKRARSANVGPDAAAQVGASPGAVAEGDRVTELLRHEGTIALKLGRLKTGKLLFEDVDAALQIASGTARLQRLDAKLYGGTLSGSGSLTGAEGADAVRLDARLAAVDLSALLGALGDVRNLEGRVNASVELAARGTDAAQWKNTLSGPVQIDIAEPALQGLSVEELVCRAAATLNKETLGARFEPVTRFRDFATALDFHQGVGTFRALHASLPDMSVRGEGRIDLPGRRLNVQIGARVTNDLAKFDPACRMTRKMLAVEWPLTCKGSFDEDPKKWCRIDNDDIARIAAQLTTEEVQDKLLKKLDKFLRR